MTDIIIKIAATLAILAAMFYGEQTIESRGYDRAKAEDVAAITQLKSDAAATLAAETARALQAQQALQAQTDTQNTKDADHAKTIADLSLRLRALAGPAGRLRDPHAQSPAAGCGPGGGSAASATASAASDRAADPAQTGGLLSEELSRLLQRLQLEADAINIAYASCRARAIADREATARPP